MTVSTPPTAAPTTHLWRGSAHSDRICGPAIWDWRRMNGDTVLPRRGPDSMPPPGLPGPLGHPDGQGVVLTRAITETETYFWHACVELNAAILRDLQVSEHDISFAVMGDQVQVTATVHNQFAVRDRRCYGALRQRIPAARRVCGGSGHSRNRRRLQPGRVRIVDAERRREFCGSSGRSTGCYHRDKRNNQ